MTIKDIKELIKGYPDEKEVIFKAEIYCDSSEGNIDTSFDGIISSKIKDNILIIELSEKR